MSRPAVPHALTSPRRGALAWLCGLSVCAAGWGAATPVRAAPPALATVQVGAAEAASRYTTDGTVEAVRDARVASQVPGRIVALAVRAGERVQAGQVLARIDPSVVNHQVAGSQAQLAQAQAQVGVARNELQRTRQLVARAYVSQAALEQAEAQARAAEAQVQALQAQVAAVSAQAGLHVVRAPFAGWVAQVPVSLGDAAAPGQMLMQVYDPSALRVTAAVPESVAARLRAGGEAAVSALQGDAVVQGTNVEVLPAVDPASRTVTVRVALPAAPTGWKPGQSVRLALPVSGEAGGVAARTVVPRSAVVTRSELHGVYVVGQDGGARLRQVRLGRVSGETVEVLAGLDAGERVAVDPVAAARAPAR